MKSSTIAYRFFVLRSPCALTMFLLLICIAEGTVWGQSSVTDEDLASLSEGLREADVSVGMHMASLTDEGLMNASRMAFWKDMDPIDHIYSDNGCSNSPMNF